MSDLEKYYTIVPQPQYIQSLAQIYAQRKLARLAELLILAGDRLKVDVYDLVDRVSKLQTSLRLSHKVHGATFEIELAMRTEQWKPLRELLLALKSTENFTVSVDKMEICSIEDSGYDAKYIDRKVINRPKEYTDRSRPEPVSQKDVALVRKVVPEIFERARPTLPGYIKEIETYITSLRLFQKSPLGSFSDSRIFGAVYLRMPEKNAHAYFLEELIHETTHSHLFVLLGLDPIVLNDPEEKYSSPIRKDPRPMWGLLHSNFVLWRLENALKACLEAGLPFEGLEEQYRHNSEALKNGLSTLEKYAIVTPLGRSLLNSMGLNVKATQVNGKQAA